MLATSNIKIVSLNTNKVSPVITQGANGCLSSTPTTTTLKTSTSNNSSNKEGSGVIKVKSGGSLSGSDNGNGNSCKNSFANIHHKTNKQGESNQNINNISNRKTKFEHRNSTTKLQHQQQQQTYQNYNNISNSNRMKNQNYNSNGNNNYNNCSGTSSINRNKYQQQQQNYYRHQQQQQHKQQAHYFKNIQKERQQHLSTITAPSNTVNSKSTATTIANDVDLVIQQQQQSHQERNNTNTTTSSTYTTLETIPKCQLQQRKCETLSPSNSSNSSFLSTATKIPSIVSSSASSANSNKFVVAACAISTVNSSNSIATNQNSTKATTKSSCLKATPTLPTTVSELDTSLTTTVVTKNKSNWKNSNSIGRSEASSTIATCTQSSPIVTNEKVDNILSKNLTKNTSVDKKSIDSNSEISLNENSNYQKLCNNAVLNAVTTSNLSAQQKEIAKHKGSQSIEKKAMTTTVTGNHDVSVVVIKKLTPNSSNTSTSTTSKNAATISTSKREKDACDKKSNTKQMLKDDNISNCNSDSNTTNIKVSTVIKGEGSAERQNIPSSASSSTISSTSTTKPSFSSPNNSYSLDFLHSVGVKMTGGTMRSSQGTPHASYGCGNQLALPSQVHNNNGTYANMSMNQRQQRYVYGCNNNNNNKTNIENRSGRQHYQHQHHYHHQPKQLTIASFLRKDLLEETLNSGGSRNTSNVSNVRNTNNYNNDQQQQANCQRYPNSYYPSSSYHQRQQQHQAIVIPYTNVMSEAEVTVGAGNDSYARSLPRLATHTAGDGRGVNVQRPYTSYPDCNKLSNEEVNGENSSIQQVLANQLQSNSEHLEISPGTANNKKSYASSIASSCSTSSSKSISSNSSNNSSRQMSNRNTRNQGSFKSSKNLNLAIETLQVKSFVNGSNQRGNHRAHHHRHHNQYYHHQHHHYGRHGAVGSHHHHSLHSIVNSPNLLQHQNYYNLTYVSTDGFASSSAVTSQICSPAPQTHPSPISLSTASTCHNSKTIESSPAGTVAMLMNFNTNQLQYPYYSNTPHLSAHHQQQQQFYHCQQQQNFLNKKVMTPLTLTMPSPSHTPTVACNTSTVSIDTQQGPSQGVTLQNIPCCPQLDKATTATATQAFTTPVAGGKDYDSDSSLSHSCPQPTTQYHTLKSSMSSLSSSTSFSASSTSTEPLSLTQQNCSQSTTPSSACGSMTPLQSPLGYNYGRGCGDIQVNQDMVQQQQQESICKSNGETTLTQQLSQIYQNEVDDNNVSSLLNSPTQSSSIFSDDDCHNQQLPHQQFCFNSVASNNQFNVSVLTNRSNLTGDYWFPSYHGNQFLHRHYTLAQMSSMPTPPPPPPPSLSATTTTLPSSSCGVSSISSISPNLQSSEHIFSDGIQQQTQQHHLHQNNIVNIGASSSPPHSPSSDCPSKQFCHLAIDAKRTCANEYNPVDVAPSKYNNTSLYSTTAGICESNNNRVDINFNYLNGGTDYKLDSPQLLAQQQQRLIAQQQTYQSSTSSTSSVTNSSFSNDGRARVDIGVGVPGCNNQMQPHNSLKTSNSVIANGLQHPQQLKQQQIQHLYPHQQQQAFSAPPPSLPPHNLLFNNIQTQHIRALNSSPSINSSLYSFFTHTPPDRFMARAHLIETKETPSALLNNSKWDNLSQAIWTKFLTSQQTEETFKQKMRLWRYLYLFVKNAYPRYGLYLVGSTISGFGSDSSDVDMCLVSRSASSIDPRMEALFNLTVLRDCLSKSGEFENFNLIEAKVPILRFRDRLHQLEVDLNFNNSVGIKNTHLLYYYSQLDWRLRPLVLVTKLWAQYHNINNAKNMTISSYSLVLMVIHFLQYDVKPPVLPCLHDIFPDKFPLLRSNDFGYVDMNETICPYESKNSQTIGELFLNFLRYYSRFDYSQHAISVRKGGLLPINECRLAKSPKNDIHQWKELCIEEPFDLTNTARSVYDYETFERVKAIFNASWHILRESLDLNSIFSPINLPLSISNTKNSGDIAMFENTSSTTTLTVADDINHTTNTKAQLSQQYTNINYLVNDYNFTSSSDNYKEIRSYNDHMDINKIERNENNDNSADAANTTNNLQQFPKFKEHNSTSLTPRLTLYESFGVETKQPLPSSYFLSSLNSLNYIQSNINNRSNNINTDSTTPTAAAAISKFS